MSEPAPVAAPTAIVASTPYLCVADLQRALDYYVGKLGFTCPGLWGQPPSFAMPRRDGFVVMLKQVDGAKPVPSRQQGGFWDVYFRVVDVQALFAELTARGARFVYAPEFMDEYDMLECAIEDPDGHVLAFGQEWDADREQRRQAAANKT